MISCTGAEGRRLRKDIAELACVAGPDTDVLAEEE
jgi:hypothetical protein